MLICSQSKQASAWEGRLQPQADCREKCLKTEHSAIPIDSHPLPCARTSMHPKFCSVSAFRNDWCLKLSKYSCCVSENKNLRLRAIISPHLDYAVKAAGCSLGFAFHPPLYSPAPILSRVGSLWSDTLEQPAFGVPQVRCRLACFVKSHVAPAFSDVSLPSAFGPFVEIFRKDA